ncbi:MAG: hypothetical protein AWU57_3745 [Marinobacter sp. T13-3]|nr:MAG: hypothetical protein AWU57_3745 [Marinobacter sp. T13-3]
MGLSKNPEKQLDQLQEAWLDEEKGDSYKLSVSALKLMLEQHGPLQELIKNIALGAEDQAEDTNHNEKIDRLIHENDRLKSTIEQKYNEISALKNSIYKLEKELSDLTSELPAVSFLRDNPKLASRFGLHEISDNPKEAIVQIVSVFSQPMNLESLWKYLTELCESQCRQASNDEICFLETVLSWINNNRKIHQYQLIKPYPKENYDFEKHLRSTQTETGEIIEKILLPGVDSGNGKILCKPLVTTCP